MEITDTEEADTTAITAPTEDATSTFTEEDTSQMIQDQVTFTTEHHQVGILQKHGVIHSERGSKTCNFGFISQNLM